MSLTKFKEAAMPFVDFENAEGQIYAYQLIRDALLKLFARQAGHGAHAAA